MVIWSWQNWGKIEIWQPAHGWCLGREREHIFGGPLLFLAHTTTPRIGFVSKSGNSQSRWFTFGSPLETAPKGPSEKDAPMCNSTSHLQRGLLTPNRRRSPFPAKAAWDLIPKSQTFAGQNTQQLVCVCIYIYIFIGYLFLGWFKEQPK